MSSKRATLLAILALLFVLAPAGLAADTPRSGGPLSLLHVRIVRLSFVSGDVALKRPDETDWTSASVNTPIEEGFSLATGANAFAEVEFENGSTARVGQGSELLFTQLALTQQGDKINRLELGKGYATFHFTTQHHDQYEVDASGVAMTVHGKAEFRTNLENEALHIEVLEGDVETQHDGKSEQVTKNHVLSYDPNAKEAMAREDGFSRDSWDKWTQARDQQALAATNDESFALDRNMFGWADLDTYGDWSYFPGYGYGWAPYEPAGWSPYSAGMWGYYPGWGFTWISAEPWGWLPFHNGFWNYGAGMGWFWVPGPLDAWSPALVNWYSGNGWVGWAPVGVGGGACTISTAGCLTAVAPSAIGAPIRPSSPIVVHPADRTGMTRVSAPQLAEGAPRPGTAVAIHGAAATTVGVHAAPATVITGNSVTPDAFLSHHGFLSGPQAIHAQLGRTMGGTFPTVVGRNGQLAPDPKFHPATMPAGAGVSGPVATHPANAPVSVRAPVVMAHGGEGGGAAASFNEHGGIAPRAPTASFATGGGAAGPGPSGVASPSATSAATASSAHSAAMAAGAGGAGRMAGGGAGNSAPANGPSGAHR